MKPLLTSSCVHLPLGRWLFLCFELLDGQFDYILWYKVCGSIIEFCTCYIFRACARPVWQQSWSGLAWNMDINFSLVQPSLKQNSKFLPEPGPVNFISNFDLEGLKDFKTGPFSCLHIIKVFFHWWLIFLQFFKTTDSTVFHNS